MAAVDSFSGSTSLNGQVESNTVVRPLHIHTHSPRQSHVSETEETAKQMISQRSTIGVYQTNRDDFPVRLARDTQPQTRAPQYAGANSAMRVLSPGGVHGVSLRKG